MAEIIRFLMDWPGRVGFINDILSILPPEMQDTAKLYIAGGALGFGSLAALLLTIFLYLRIRLWIDPNWVPKRKQRRRFPLWVRNYIGRSYHELIISAFIIIIIIFLLVLLVTGVYHQLREWM
jgi:hypothetical protein